MNSRILIKSIFMEKPERIISRLGGAEAGKSGRKSVRGFWLHPVRNTLGSPFHEI